ncbi:hypothetical protein [Mycobacteroides franklinii]|uniref:hypothetical protein n=1 Tax=Mycobacteroides franklinii TaxID=948102 RepID=UPI0013E8B683
MRRFAVLLAAAATAITVLHCMAAGPTGPALAADRGHLSAPAAATPGADAVRAVLGPAHPWVHCLPGAPTIDLGDSPGLGPVSGPAQTSATAYHQLQTPGPRAPPWLAPSGGGRNLRYRLCVIRR